MKRLYVKRTPKDLRMKIVREYLTGDLSSKELQEKYDLPSSHIVNVWVSRYRETEKSLSLPLKSENRHPMAIIKKTNPTEENEALKKHIKELEDRLHYSELENLALNTMIDVAEEHGIQIRKKSGAKQ